MFHECSVCSLETEAGCAALVHTQMLQEEYNEVMTRDSNLNATAVGKTGQKNRLCLRTELSWRETRRPADEKE